MRLLAPAKINWTLEVLGRRDDGYHEVRTVLQTVEPCDVLELAEAETLELAVEGEHEAAEDDLVLRAARLLDGGRGWGCRMRLVKRLPVAAGLGGGSADAAAALRGLDALWGLGLDERRLAELAAVLGSDVPFFLHGGTALAEGRGERVTPLPDARPAWLVLLVPPLRLAEKTKRMYGSLTRSDFGDGSRTQALVERVRAGLALEDAALHNVFERSAFETFRGLAAHREALLAAGARRVHVAGAGPALFALAPDEAEARAIQARLQAPAGRALVARTLTAAEAGRVEE